jgi:hypothetical protein
MLLRYICKKCGKEPLKNEANNNENWYERTIILINEKNANARLYKEENASEILMGIERASNKIWDRRKI